MQLFSQVGSIIDTLPYFINAEKLVNDTRHNKSSFSEFPTFNQNKPYVPITGCVFEHITATADLSSLEKLFYLFTNSLSFINNKTNTVGSRQRAVSLPAKTWAKLLNCSRSQVFSLQKSLEQKGYLFINRDKNNYTQNKRNLLTPTLSDSVLKSLCKTPDKLQEEHSAYDSSRESKLEYLDRTKLFIPLNYGLLKVITSNEELSPLQKVIWLDFYAKCYKCYISSNRTFGFSFITSYEELMERYGCSRASLSKAMSTLENNNFIAKTRFFRKKDHALEDRQDKSLWQITLFIPASYNLELINIKDRKGIAIESDYLEKSNNDTEGLPISSKKILFNGNSVNYCNDKIDNIVNDYINNVLEEITDIDTNNNNVVSINSLLNPDNNNTITIDESIVDKPLNSSEIQDNISSPDPHVSKSSLHINKYLILKIKDIKSNLRAKPKVLFNDFLKKFRKEGSIGDYSNDDESSKKQKTNCEFNICSELIRNKLKELPKDKAEKARKFAYSIVSKKLATGYAESLNKHELAKQLIYHAATWKPTKLGNISREKEIDTALSVAWKSIVGGTWQPPLEWAKAEVLNYEYRYYRKKYQESGVMSYEVKSLESAVNSVLGGWYNLEGKIIEESKASRKNNELISIINTQKLIGNKNYQLEPEAKSCSYQQNLSLLDDKGQTINITDYCTDDYLETENHSYHQKINLLHIPEEQKYLKLQGGNTDLVEINTVNHKQCFGKLKTLEVMQGGDLVLTMKPSSNRSFADLSVDNDFRSHSLDYDNIIITPPQNTQKLKTKSIDNTLTFFKNHLQDTDLHLESNLETVSDIQTKVASTGAVKIDSIIGDYLKNLKIL